MQAFIIQLKNSQNYFLLNQNKKKYFKSILLLIYLPNTELKISNHANLILLRASNYEN